MSERLKISVTKTVGRNSITRAIELRLDPSDTRIDALLQRLEAEKPFEATPERLAEERRQFLRGRK